MSLATDDRFALRWRELYPCLDDKTATTDFDSHYVLHTAWAARILAESRPECHVDISSYIYFCSIVSAFIPVKYFEYRPAKLELSNLESSVADLKALPFASGTIRSLSCMHVVEHIGLGRYDDPLDPEGDLKAIAELKRVLAPGGELLFVVPIGKPCLRFNAHRIYSTEQILSYFAGLELKEFCLIPDEGTAGGLLRHASREMADMQGHGCGCFRFSKGS